MKKLLAVLVAAVLISACTVNYGWGHDGCAGLPSTEKVEQVLKEHDSLIEKLKEERLIDYAHEVQCATTVKFSDTRKAGEIETRSLIYINLIANEEQVLAVLDERGARSEGLTMFYGVPFRFVRH